MSQEFWSKDERERLDHVVIQGVVNTRTSERTISPGTAVLLGADGRPLDWQVQRGPGLSGYRQSFWGLGLAEFQIKITVHTRDDRAQFELWESVVEPSPAGSPQKIFRIEHPILAVKKISRCVFLNDPFPEIDGNIGWTIVTHKCREWREPLPTISSPAEPENKAEKTHSDYRSAELEAEAAGWKEIATKFQENP